VESFRKPSSSPATEPVEYYYVLNLCVGQKIARGIGEFSLCTPRYIVAYRVNFISLWIAILTASSTSFASKVGAFDFDNDDRSRGS